MHNLLANTRNELHKLLLKRKVIALLLATALLPILIALSLEHVQAAFGFLAVGRSDFPLWMLGLFASALLPLTLFLLAADMFAGEVGANTLKLVLTRPITRFAIFGSKVLALAVFLAAELVIVGVVSTGAGWFIGADRTAQGLFDGLLAYAVAFMPLLAILCFAALLAQVFRSALGAVMTGVGLYAAAKLLPFFLPEAAVYLPFHYTDWHTLWIEAPSFPQLIQPFLVLLGCSIMTYSGGFVLFDRKEV